MNRNLLGIRHLDPAMVTLAQEGQAAFRARFELVYGSEQHQGYGIATVDGHKQAEKDGKHHSRWYGATLAFEYDGEAEGAAVNDAC